MKTPFIRESQELLGIKSDGVIGPITMRAALAVFNNPSWSNERILYGAAQTILNKEGHHAGDVDGLPGHNTRNAYDEWRAKRAGTPIVIDRTGPSGGALAFPKHADVESFYGAPGSARATAGRVTFPFPHFLAWNTSEAVNTFRCHELCAPTFQAIFNDTAKHYGEDEYRRLRLDLFGGCFNNRPMRGGSRPSTHAFGAAVDLDPERNQLRWGRDRASFARPEYDAFWKIVEGHGAVSLGRARNFDWMHFQLVRL